jgi:hypothetical protein
MSDEISSAKNSVSHEDQLLAKVREWGGHAGNVSLQRALEWDGNLYWAIRDRLVDLGLLELGKGRGGSVSIVSQAVANETPASVGPPEQQPSLNIPEGSLYEPVAQVLRSEWARDKRFRSCIVEVTAKQGRRDTGGTWTRPDIVVAALRVFAHIPGKFFDLITFELKPLDGIDVTGVF